jgi:long-subunit fatty acid transport protein
MILRTATALALWAALGCVHASAAADELPPQAQELSLTAASMGFGARALGMGGAHIAVVEDVSALWYNPAGLAQIRRIEAAGTLAFDRLDREVTLSGKASQVDLRSTHINSIGFAYPFPTYRGSLVVGGAYNRHLDLSSDYLRRGSLPPYGSNEEESIFEEGSLDNWTLGVAGDISPNVSIGASLSYLSGSSTIRNDFDYGDPMLGYAETAYRETDISGLTGAFGSLVRLGPLARMGFAVQFPQDLDLEGVSDGAWTWTNGDSTDSDSYSQSFLDEVHLPLTLGAGLALTPSNLILSADVRYNDWTQLRYAGPMWAEITDASGDSVRVDAYRSTVEVHVGAEYMLPVYPVRLRAGFYTEPVAYRLMLTDVYGKVNRITEFDPDRAFFTAGIGALFEEVLTVDVAYVHGRFKRTAVQPFAGGLDIVQSEQQTVDRVYLTTSYRF